MCRRYQVYPDTGDSKAREWHPRCFLVGHKSNDAVDDGDSACDPRTASHIREQAVGLEDCCVIRREVIKRCRQVEEKGEYRICREGPKN